MSRLLHDGELESTPDLNQQEAGDIASTEGYDLTYVDAAGQVFVVTLVKEDGWVKIPDTDAVARFASGCRRRMRQDVQLADELPFDEEVLGSGYTEEAKDLLRSKHEDGAFNLCPVPLLHGFEDT